MAYSITKQGDDTTYGITNYVVNSTADVATVPTTAATGSTILVIGSGEVYMLSVPVGGVKTWTLIGSEGS